MEGTIMKVVFEKVVGGNVVLVTATTPAGDQGAYVLSMVKAGNPFWAWASIPSGRVIGCDFSNAPICADNAADNNILIGSITADPADILTYQT